MYGNRYVCMRLKPYTRYCGCAAVTLDALYVAGRRLHTALSVGTTSTAREGL